MADTNMHYYTYKVYGLIIRSEIEIPELTDVDEENVLKYDCTISYGIVPREITKSLIKGTWYQISKKEFYMHINGVAHYYVCNGNSIIVEPEKCIDMRILRVFLLGSSLGLIMSQRNIIALHGGTVAVNDGGIILCGGTGAGKSTLNSAFRKEGFSFLSDDVSALGEDCNGKIVVHPTYSQVKLCKDAMIKMDYDIKDIDLIDNERDKYAIPLNKFFLNYSIPLIGIYEISVGDISTVEINEITGNEKLKIILGNIYRIELIGCLGLDRDYFKKCLEVVKNIPVYRLIRPRDKFTVNEQVHKIKSTLRVDSRIVV